MFASTRLTFLFVCIAITAAACAPSEEPESQPATAVEDRGGKTDSTAASCDYNNAWLADSSWDLRDAAEETTHYTDADIDDLSDLQKTQIFAAAVHLQALGNHEAFEVVFASVDEGDVYYSSVKLGEASFDWVKFYLGDTEVGVVFEAGSQNLVAEIGDGDVLGCVAVPATVACSYDTTWLYDSSGDMERFVTGSERIEAADADTAKPIQLEQITAATQHLELANSSDLAEVFGASDDGDFSIRRVEAVGNFDWIKFYAGDTEVGLVFEADSLNIVAEIGDGDVLGCKQVAAPDDSTPDDSTPGDSTPDDATPDVCNYSSTWLAEDWRDLDDAAGTTLTVKSDTTIDDVTADQIFAATVLLTDVGADEAFDVVFASVDDGTFYVSVVELDGQAFNWVKLYLGDVQVGAVYEAGTTNLVAEISDGDVFGCVAP